MQTTLTSSRGWSQETVRSFMQSRTGRFAAIVSATIFIAICAHVSVPLPFTPVPLTMQDLAVLLVGMALGPGAGAAALALYVAEGAAGIPVFNPQGVGGVAQLLGPTGGFLMAYPLVAAIAGWGVRSLRLSNVFGRGLVACLLADVALFGFGAIWFAQIAHASAGTSVQMTVLPFLPGNLVKVAAAAGIFSALHRAKRA